MENKLATMIRELQEFVDRSEFHVRCPGCGAVSHVHELAHYQIKSFSGEVVKIGPKCPHCGSDIESKNND